MVKKLLCLITMSVGLLFPTIAQNVPAYVPKDGLVGWWPFNGNANDESGNNNNGTVNGATLTSDRFGQIGKSYIFDGVSSYISTNYAGVLGNNNRTISFWAKHIEVFTNQCASCSRRTVISYGSNITGPSQIGQGFNCEFNIGLNGICFDGNETAAAYKTNSPVNDNNWHHYVYVFNNVSNVTTVMIYQDGIQLFNPSYTYLPSFKINTTLGSKMEFGRRTYNTQNPTYYKGGIDDVGFWNRPLSQEEITALYTSTSPCTNPTARITPQGNTTFCQGGYVNLNATQGANYSYQWYNTNQLINGANSYFYQATAPGEYKVTIKDGACSATSNATTVIVNPLPIANITPDGPTEFCQGGSVNLIASGGSSYKWNSGNTSAVMKVTQTGTYYVNVINSYGCSNYASYDVNVNSLPEINFVALNQFTLKNSQPVQLVATPIGGTFNGEGVSGMSFNPSVAKLGKKIITYNYTSPQGCTGSASRTTIVVDSIGNVCNVTNYDTIRTTITDTVSVLKIKVKFTTGIKANQLTTISVFPNPTSDVLLLETTDVQAFSGYKYQITDAQGKLVYNQFITAAKTEISMKSLGASGIYVLRILDGKGVSIKENKIVLAE